MALPGYTYMSHDVARLHLHVQKNQVTLYVLVLRKQLTFTAVVHIVHNFLTFVLTLCCEVTKTEIPKQN